ncbi:regulatory protein RecX [Maribacter algicola]|uniref:Regulatory protein RecX n=1 Tax=Meishania litoralis TaxID=3434685 RepID=A0ACC7LIJ6_9FLAO
MARHSKFTFKEALKKLERYCAYQERCHIEVRNKLWELGIRNDEIDQIVVHLINNDYLNEERFAKTFVHGKFSIKKWGRNRIINELEQRKISKYNIASALEEIHEDAYLKSFHLLAEKKWESLASNDLLKRKKKLADYLFYRGWESDLVYAKINELTK